MKEIILIKLNRISAWILLVFVFLFIISGYGMTKQIIDPVLAAKIHNTLIPIPFFVVFIFHISLCIRLALRRNRIFKSEISSDIFVIILGIILFLFFLWLFFI